MLRGSEEMITLEKACEIAKNFLKAKNLDLINNCKDLGDKWIFDFVDKHNPYDVPTDGLLLAVEKETGKAQWYSMEVPGTKNFDSYFNAPEVNIKKYVGQSKISNDERLSKFLEELGIED